MIRTRRSMITGSMLMLMMLAISSCGSSSGGAFPPLGIETSVEATDPAERSVVSTTANTEPVIETTPPTVAVDVADGRPTGWPFRNRSRDPLPDEIQAPDPGGISNPVTGGGVTVSVVKAELRRKDDLQATVALEIHLTNNSLTETLDYTSIASVQLWCRMPATFAGNAFMQASGFGLPDDTVNPPIEPLQSVDLDPLWEIINLPLNDCRPLVTIELVEAPPGSDTADTIRDPDGHLLLVLPIDLVALEKAAPPLADDVPSIVEMCNRLIPAISELFPGETDLVRSASQPCEWDQGEHGAFAVFVELDAAFGPLTIDPPEFNWAPSPEFGTGAVEGAADGYAGVSLNTGTYKLQVTARGDGQLARTIFRLVTGAPAAADPTPTVPAPTVPPPTVPAPAVPPPTIAANANCPEYGELAQRGDGIPTPCESIAGLQRVLDGDGYPLDDDGRFGPGTEAAVRAFQADHGLPVTGMVDAATWYAILPPD